jgi:hypothetical protein
LLVLPDEPIRCSLLFSCSFFLTSLAYNFANVLEVFTFHTRPYSNASVDRATGQGPRISLASKNPFLLALVLSIRHSQNYGVKTRKSRGRGKYPLPVSSTKRYFKSRSIRLPYGTIYGNRNMFPFPDGNKNVFPGNVFPFPLQQLMATETSFRFQPTSLVIMACI